MNKNRLISSVIMIAVTTAAVIYEWLFIIALLALTIAGLYEFFYLIKKKGIPIYSYTGIIIGALIPISIFFHFEPTKGWELFFIVLVLLMIFLMQFMRKENTNAIVGISTTLFGVLYVSWFFSFLIKVRYLLPDMQGIKLLAFIIIITKLGDIGALLIGSRWGRHPLFPRVSPKKTIEGCLGSFVFSIGAAIMFKSFLPPQIPFALFDIIFIGAFFGGLGQLGDMSESLIKRDCNVKDSGKMLAGLGGTLDIIDSMLFSAPAFYFFMSAILSTV